MKVLFFLIIVSVLNGACSRNIFSYEQKLAITEEYSTQEISFTSITDGIQLSGTLIFPNTSFDKTVIIVPGSGKDTRHAHHLLAQEFLKNHIAVYRFDERGIGDSKGRYNETASSLQKDVISAYNELKNTTRLSNKKIGIVGHSLGGIASIGALSKGCNFDFLIQMATPVENNGAFLQYQVSTNIVGFYTVKGKTEAQVITFINTLRKAVQFDEDYQTSKAKAKAIIKQQNFQNGKHIINPAIIDLMKQNHEISYKESEVPILYIIGSEDKVVSAIDEIEILKKMNNPLITISLIHETDHYLNDISDNKNPSRYEISPAALDEIIQWTLTL